MNDHLMAIKLVIGGTLMFVVSAYAPQVGPEYEVKRKFYEYLDELVRVLLQTESFSWEETLMVTLGRAEMV